MLIDVFRALGRRWYVLVLGVMVTAALGYGAYFVSPPEYTARGLVLVLPSEATIAETGNPFLALSDLDLPARLVVAYFQSETAENAVEAIAPTAEFQVAIEESTRGPVIAVDVTDETPASALTTLRYLVDDIPVQLARMQDEVNVPASDTVRSMPFTVDSRAETDLSGTLRIIIAAVAVGLAATGLVAFFLDGMLLRRRAHRTAAAPPSVDEEDVDEEDEEDQDESDELDFDVTLPDTSSLEHEPRAARTQAVR